MATMMLLYFPIPHVESIHHPLEWYPSLASLEKYWFQLLAFTSSLFFMQGFSGYCFRLATSCDVCRRLRTALAVEDFCCRSQRRWRRRDSVNSVASMLRRLVRGDIAA